LRTWFVITIFDAGEITSAKRDHSKMADDDVVPPTGRKPEQPPTDWMSGMNDASNQVVQIHREAARRSAVVGMTGSSMPPPLAAAPFAPELTVSADAQVVKAAGDTRRRFEQQFSNHPAEIRDAARALAQAVKDQIAKMKEARRNDVGDFINFLEWVAQELDRLVDALDRAIKDPDDQQPIFLGEAGKIANHLKTGLYEYLEQHRADISGHMITGGLVIAAAGFLHACGFDLASIISIFRK
jgi:hypothetical protein